MDPAARAGRPARWGLPGRAGWIRVFGPGGFGGGEGRRRPADPPHLRGGGATGLRKPAPLRSSVGSRCFCVAYPKPQSNSPGGRLRGSAEPSPPTRRARRSQSQPHRPPGLGQTRGSPPAATADRRRWSQAKLRCRAKAIPVSSITTRTLLKTLISRHQQTSHEQQVKSRHISITVSS